MGGLPILAWKSSLQQPLPYIDMYLVLDLFLISMHSGMCIASIRYLGNM